MKLKVYTLIIRLLESLCSSVRPFVRPSPKSTASYIQHIYITESYVDLCNVHHTSVHHTYMIQEASYIHKSQKRCVVSCIIHSGSRPKIISMCIIHIYVSGSMIEEHRYMHHTCMYQDQNHGKMHHKYVHRNHIRLLESPCPSVRSSVTEKYRIIDSRIIYAYHIGIIHTCIRVKDRGTQIYASYMHVSGSIIMDKCIIHMCIIVMCIRIDICIIRACTMIKDHGHTHHGLDKCIIHKCIIVTCIRIGYAAYMHVSGSRIMDTCIMDTLTCIMDT